MAECLLYLDTTGSILKLAVGNKESLFCRIEEASTSHRYHSAILIPTIQDALAGQGLTPHDLAGLAVNIGPGSFTGIRTGLTTVRIMAQFLNLPVYAFNVFELLAVLHESLQPRHILTDALRGRAYYAEMAYSSQKVPHCLSHSLVQLPEAAQWQGPVLASETLRTCLPEGVDVSFFSEAAAFSPEAMRILLQRNVGAFLKSWNQVLPLYIQAPNITMRKIKPGHIA